MTNFDNSAWGVQGREMRNDTADSDEFWRKWNEPRKRQEMLQRLYDALMASHHTPKGGQE